LIEPGQFLLKMAEMWLRRTLHAGGMSLQVESGHGSRLKSPEKVQCRNDRQARPSLR
jgi:hypothetical protein